MPIKEMPLNYYFAINLRSTAWESSALYGRIQEIQYILDLLMILTSQHHMLLICNETVWHGGVDIWESTYAWVLPFIEGYMASPVPFAFYLKHFRGLLTSDTLWNSNLIDSNRILLFPALIIFFMPTWYLGLQNANDFYCYTPCIP